MKKLIIFTLMFLFLFSYVSATTWTRSVDYLKEDVRQVEFKNWFGLGDTQGTMTLSSHELTSKGDIKRLEVGLGNQVVMYYDFSFNELVSNGLGEVEFIDMRTGKKIDKEYRFVIPEYTHWEIPIYKEVCPQVKILFKEDSSEYEEWKLENCKWEFDYMDTSSPRIIWNEYNSKDIPKGDIRIGIEVNVEKDDWIDGIWNIGSKKLDKHAQWVEGDAGFIYTAGAGNQSVVKYDKDFNIVAVSPNYGATINSVITDDDYVYYVGWNYGGLKKAYKENLTQIYSLSNYRDFVVYVDDLYLYRGGYEKKVVKYNKTNGAYISEFGFGDDVYSITSDDTYLYTGGGNRVDRRNKHDFSSSSNVNPGGGGTTYTLYLDGDYLYLGGNYNDAPHLRKLNKTNLVEIGTGVSDINIQSIVIDDGFIYAGGLTSGKQLMKIYKSNLSIAQTTSSYQGVQELAIDNNFIYLAGVDQRVKQVYKTNLSLFANFPSYGGGLQSVTLDAKIVLNINLISPINNYETNINTINFEAEIKDNELGVINVSLVINGSIVQTNSSGLNGTYNFLVEDLEDGYYEWYIEAYDDTDKYYTSEKRYFTIDTDEPTISLDSPNGSLGVLEEGIFELNFTANDDNLDTCWYIYGTNEEEISCSSGVLVNENINFTNERVITVCANDTIGNEKCITSDFNWSIRLNMLTHEGVYITNYQWIIDNITYNENPLIRNSMIFLENLTDNELDVQAIDNQRYYYNYNDTINFNVNQTIYNVTLEPKDLIINFFLENGSSYNTKGYWVDSTGNNNYFENVTLEIPLLEMEEGKIEVFFGYNLTDYSNYTQFYEFNNEWGIPIEENITIIEDVSRASYIKTLDELSGDAINDVLLRFYSIEPNETDSKKFIGQRYSGGQSGTGLTFLWSPADKHTHIVSEKNNYETGYDNVDLNLEDYSKTEPFIIRMEMGLVNLFGNIRVSTCGWYNPDTESIPLSFYSITEGDITYNTSHSEVSEYSVNIEKDGRALVYLTNGNQFNNLITTNLTVYIYDDNELKITLVIPYMNTEESKFTEPKGLNEETKVRMLWLGLIFVVGVLGLVIKKSDEDIGDGGFGKIFFFMGTFIIAIISQGSLNWLFFITGFYLFLMAIRRLIQE